MKIIFLILAMLFMQSCSHTETKKPLNYLNGENYHNAEQADPIGTLPILYGKERITQLDGTVVMSEGPARIPLKMQKVILKKEDKILAETVTGLDGKYSFRGIFINGRYQLVSESKAYQGNLVFHISDYKHNNLDIIANPKE